MATKYMSDYDLSLRDVKIRLSSPIQLAVKPAAYNANRFTRTGRTRHQETKP
jgi:hypothetical protein